MAALVLLQWIPAQAAQPPPGKPQPPRPSLYGRVAIELLRIPEDKLNLGDAALRLSTLIMTGESYDAERLQLDELAARVATAIKHKGRDDPEFRIVAITSLLHEMGYRYAFDDMEGINPDNSLLLSVLRTKRGNCIAMPTLWYAVAERLGYPVFAVAAPNHVFMRYDDGTFRANIETTSSGRVTDERMISDLEIPDAAVRSGAFMRSLTKREFLAILIANVAEKLIRMRNYGLAIELNEDALAALPANIQAHWNLALAYNELAFARLARNEGVARRSGTAKAELPPEAGKAMEHAAIATRLGAPKPLEKDYWKRVSSLGETSLVVKRAQAEPFEVTSLLMPQSARVQVNWTWAVDPVLYQSALGNETGCAHFCSRFCGLAPGNLCAEDLIRRGLMR